MAAMLEVNTIRSTVPALAAESRTDVVPSTAGLTIAVQGSRAAIFTGEATWKSPEQPRRGASKAPSRVRSAENNASRSAASGTSRRRWDTFAPSAASLTVACTRYPRSSSTRTTWVPMNPAAPVTQTVLMLVSSFIKVAFLRVRGAPYGTRCSRGGGQSNGRAPISSGRQEGMRKSCQASGPVSGSGSCAVQPAPR